MSVPTARDAYLAAVVAGDRAAAHDAVDAARAAGLGIRALYLEVFQPTLREVGRLWEENRVTVAQEHLATALTQSSMARLYDEMFVAGREDGPLLVAACADQERHEVGLRMICDLLEMEGWDTVFLGSSVPLPDLVAEILARRPRVVALSASLSSHVARVAEAIAGIRAAAPPEVAPIIAVGGRPFLADPELAARIGADLTAADAAEVADRLRTRLAA